MNPRVRYEIPTQVEPNMLKQVTKLVLTLAAVVIFSHTLLMPSAFAQLLPQATAPEEKVAVDPLGRTTPRGTVEG